MVDGHMHDEFISDSWYLLAKNGRINSEFRQLCLLGELSFTLWDIVCISETRCSSQDIILQGGHRFLAHRGDYHASGVAILIHKNHAHNIKHIMYISDRVMAIDIQMGCKIMRVIALYLPHAGYPWDDFYIMHQSIISID